MAENPFTVNENDVAFLKAQWDDLLSVYTSDESIKDNSFHLLKEKYSEKSRFYHNLSHVKALLHLLESLSSEVEDQGAIRFSIWFHDAVYNTRRDDNEEESTRLASVMLGDLHVDRETIELTKDLILATKSHGGKHLSREAKLFLDMDLAILGMSEEVYEEYSKAIRQEYFWVSEPVYRSGRRKILESFLGRETIYFTDEMKVRFEGQARKNLHGEIQSLGMY
jgi:predicted metal-dependent HD superfamily phosphohydrolase